MRFFDMKDCKEAILSESYRDFMFNSRWMQLLDGLDPKSWCRKEAGQMYWNVYIQEEEADRLPINDIPYYSIPKCFTLLDLGSLNAAGITPVQSYPSLELKGQGILMGFLDTGLDYRNPVFRNLDGSTRILGIWDQTIQDGNPEEHFGYGSVYTREDINRALQSEDPLAFVPSQDTNGHGTFTASVAAGSANVENQFLGAAPESMIAMVKLKGAKQYLRDYYFIKEGAEAFQENDMLAGLFYLNSLAKKYETPLVICVPLGCSLGGHNGTAPICEELEVYANMKNRVVVTGTGNEADKRHHYKGMTGTQGEGTEVELRVGENVKGFQMEVWTDIPNVLAVSLTSPSGESIQKIPIRQNSRNEYEFLFEQTKIVIDYRLLVERTNSELIIVRFENPAQGIWKIGLEPLQSIDGLFHIWMPVTEFLTGEAYFLRSSPDETILEPGSTPSAITASYYNWEENSVAIQSGRGYTRNRMIKPEFAVPGMYVTGAVPGGNFTERSGSSAGTAIAGGSAALLLQWITQNQNSQASSAQVKNILILGTRRKENTEYPNRLWGFGTMDLYHTLEEIRQL